MNLEPDGSPCEEGVDMGDFGDLPNFAPTPLREHGDTDPELAWWNGEIGGVEPMP